MKRIIIRIIGIAVIIALAMSMRSCGKVKGTENVSKAEAVPTAAIAPATPSPTAEATETPAPTPAASPSEAPQAESTEQVKEEKSVTLKEIPPEYAEYLVMYRDVLNEFYDVCYTEKYSDSSVELIKTLADLVGAKVGAADEDYVFINSLSHVYRICGEVTENIGYMFKDLNGDGTPELIIGSTRSGESPYVGYSGMEEVLMVFSCEAGKPAFVTGGWDRSHNWLLDSRALYHMGSSGAADMSFERNVVSEDGKLMTDEVWIVHGLEIYHAQKVSASDVYESVWASDPKYKVDMTMEEIDAAEQNFVDHTVHLDLIPFTQLERIE